MMAGAPPDSWLKPRCRKRSVKGRPRLPGMAPVRALPLMSRVVSSGASPRVLGTVPPSLFPRRLRYCSGDEKSKLSGMVPTMPLLAAGSEGVHIRLVMGEK